MQQVTTTRPLASSVNLFRPDLTGRFKSEMLKPKGLFIKLNLILPEAELEEKKKSSFLCLCTSAFCFLDGIFAEHKTPKMREPNETNTS